jgi:hypothetical protein
MEIIKIKVWYVDHDTKLCKKYEKIIQKIEVVGG